MILNNPQNKPFSTANAQQQSSNPLYPSLSDWIRFKRGDCPVCQGAKKDCRQNNKTSLIHCRDTSANPIDYVFRGQDALGFGMWAYKADAQQWSQERREQWQKEKQADQSRRLAHHAKTALPVEALDLAVRKLARYLGLTSEHRQQLRDRGLTDEQIEKGLFFSIAENQEIPPGIPPNFPGVDWSGQKLFTPSPGIACPAFNSDGKAIGYQIRLSTADSGKYRWPKGQVSSHLQNGELPLTITGPSLTDAEVIWLTEGILKPYITSEKWKIPCIGAAGGNHQGSPQQLLAALQQISEDCLIAIAPDAGAILNKNVLKQYEKTVKLLTDWGYGDRIQFAWWGQATKSDNDCDEISQDEFDQIQYLNPDQFDALCPDSLICRVQKWFNQQIKRSQPKGFGVPQIEGKEFEGDRGLAWLKETGNVLDASFMGDGKSHAVCSIANPVGKVWYVYHDHRNPTIAQIATEFTDLMPRLQYGLTRNQQGKLVKATQETPEENLVVKANCIRAELFNQLSEMGHDPNEGAGSNPICQSCPMAQVCKFNAGWFLHDRKQTLSAPKIRCHIDSMPRDYDYSNDIIIWDESSQSIKPTKITESDRPKLLDEIDRARDFLSSEQYQDVDKIFQSIKELFDSHQVFGETHQTILAQVQDIDLSFLNDVIEAISAHSFNLFDVFQVADTPDIGQKEKQQFKGAYKSVIAHLRAKAYQESEQNLQKLPPNALFYLLKAIRGDKGIALRISNGKLTITRDRRQDYARIFNSAKKNIFLDATANTKRIQTITGLEEKISAIRRKQDAPLRNLIIHQINTQGVASPRRMTDKAFNRVKCVLQELRQLYGEIPLIAHKCQGENLDIDGYWFNHNRGSNAFAGSRNFASLGLPYANKGAIEDEYFALNGTLDGFDEYYESRNKEEILQNVGRQRVNRYPNQQFHYFALVPHGTDLSWLSQYGAKVIVKDAFEITPEAGSETQFARHQLVQAAIDCMEKGVKVTQTAIAQVLDKTQQSISKALRKAGISLHELAKMIEEKITTAPYKDSIGTGCISNEFLNDWGWFFDLSLDAIAKEIIGVIQGGGMAKLNEYLEDYPNFAQAKVLGFLWGLMDTERTFVSERLKT